MPKEMILRFDANKAKKTRLSRENFQFDECFDFDFEVIDLS